MGFGVIVVDRKQTDRLEEFVASGRWSMNQSLVQELLELSRRLDLVERDLRVARSSRGTRWAGLLEG